MGGCAKRTGSAPIQRFGAFVFDREQLLLYERGRPIRLQNMPLEVLAVLLERPGEVISHEEFYQRLWPDDELGIIEDNLYTAISKLRRTLRDPASRPLFIETVPRRGYRFIASVSDAAEAGQSGDAEPRTEKRDLRRVFRMTGLAVILLLAGVVLWPLDRWSQPAAPPQLDANTIVVLPFDNLGNPDEIYFSDGLTDELIATLAQMNDLTVVSRTSSFAVAERDLDAREIGELLGAATLLEGSVRRSEERVRVNAQLVDAATGTQHWSHTYERELTDLFGIQEELALRISESLHSGVSRNEQARLARRPTNDPDAYAEFLRGRHFWNQRTEEAMYRAIDHYQSAIEADPEFAAAYAAMANVYSPGTVLGFFHPEEAREQVGALVEQAIALDPDHPEVLLAEAARRLLDWDWEGSENVYRRAIRAAPDGVWQRTWYGFLLHGAGRVEDALEQLEIAAEIDPLAAVPISNMAVVEIMRGRLDEAGELLLDGLEIMPDNWLLLEKQQWIHEIRGELQRALALAERIAERATNTPRPKANLARLAALSGQSSRAHGLLAELEADAESTEIYYPEVAGVYAALGELNQAFEWLERSYEQRHPRLAHLGEWPRYAPLHDDPRFDDLIDRIGFREEWSNDE